MTRHPITPGAAVSSRYPPRWPPGGRPGEPKTAGADVPAGDGTADGKGVQRVGSGAGVDGRAVGLGSGALVAGAGVCGAAQAANPHPDAMSGVE